MHIAIVANIYKTFVRVMQAVILSIMLIPFIIQQQLRTHRHTLIDPSIQISLTLSYFYQFYNQISHSIFKLKDNYHKNSSKCD